MAADFRALLRATVGLTVVILGILAAGPLVAGDRAPNADSLTRIQFQVDTGGGPFVLSVLEGAPAFVRWSDTATGSMEAFFAQVVDESRGVVEIAVFEVEQRADGLRLGRSLGTIYTQPGSPSYFPGPHFVELQPLAILVDELDHSAGVRAKGSARRGLPDDPAEAGFCCITSGGATTCACAVQVGDQSCCSPSCCGIMY